MYILIGTVDHGLVYGLCHFPLHGRRFPIRYHKSIMVQRLFIVYILQISFIILGSLFRHIPHLKEHNRKAPNRITGDFYSHILPMSVYHLPVNVFIGEIDSTGKCNFSVNNYDFSVVSVILAGREEGNDGGKHFCLDSILLKFFRITIGKQQNRTHAVIHHADLYSLLHLFFEDIKHRIPHNTAFQNKILQKNIAFCLP